MKKCPYCAEEIQDDAMKCKHCGEWLNKKDEPVLNKDVSAGKISTPQKQQPDQSTVFTPPLARQKAKTTQYAGFWKRVAAWIIDLIISSIGMVPIILILGLLLIPTTGNDGYYRAQWTELGTVVGMIFTWLYFTLMESSSKQATFGKKALKIKVADMNGNKISFGKATGRHFGKFISSIILCIGYIMVAFTQKKQGLHDIMAGCLVVNSDPEPATSDNASGVNKWVIWVASCLFIVGILVALIVPLYISISKKEQTAKYAVLAAQESVYAAKVEAANITPDEVKSLEDSLAVVKAKFSEKEYSAALQEATVLKGKADQVLDASKAKKEELTKKWTELSQGVTQMVTDIQSKVESLYKAKKLPENITRERIYQAKVAFVSLQADWNKAQASFTSGNYTEAVSIAASMKDKAVNIMELLGMYVPPSEDK